MDARNTPQGTLSQINSPLLTPQQQAPAAQPTATDTNIEPGAATLQNPVSGSATLGQRFPDFASNWKANYSSATKNAMGAGLSPLAASVVGAIHANDPTAPPPAQSKPNIVQAGAQALSGIGASLGDAAAVGTVPQGGGALTGVARTLQARSQRETAQKQQQFQNQQEARKNDVMIAEANTRMVKEQRLIHNMDEEAKQTSVNNGKAQIDAMDASGQQFNTIAKDLTYDQVQDFIKNKKLDPAKETAIPTGIKTIGQDKDGKPITAISYTLTSLPESITLDKSVAGQKASLDFLNKNNPPSGGGTWDGTTFTGAEYNLLMQQAHDKVAARLATEKAALSAGFQENEIKKSKEALDFGQDPNIINALAHSQNASGAPDFISARNALLAQSQDPNSPLYGKYQNIDNDMRQALGYTENSKGEKNYVYDKMIEDYQKKADEVGNYVTDLSKKLDTASGAEAAAIGAGASARLKDPATPAGVRPQLQRIVDRSNAQVQSSEDLKQREEESAARAKKKIDEEQPEASEADKALIRQIGEGRSLYPNPRTKQGARLASLVALAYPDFDESKAPAWFQWRRDFDNQGIGHFGGALASANATMAHIQRLYEHTTLSGILNPLSEDHNRMKTDITFIEGELGKAVKGGVIGEGEAKQIREALSGGFTVENRRDRIKEASQLLQDKIDGQQKRLERDIVPSSHITVPQLITPEAKASYDFVQSGGKEGKSITQTQQKMEQQQQATDAPKQAPKGAVDPMKFGTAANKQPVWQMNDGTVQDAQGRQYGPNGLPK